MYLDDFISKDGMFYQQKWQVYRIEVRVSSKHMYSNPEKQQKHTYINRNGILKTTISVGFDVSILLGLHRLRESVFLLQPSTKSPGSECN